MSESKAPNFFWGYLSIGFIALAGGIVMFLIVVPERVKQIPVPPDVQIVFTQFYAQQALVWNEKGSFAGDTVSGGIPAEICKQYECAMELRAGGKGYLLVLKKGGRMWQMDEKSPQAREVRVGGS
jgi:hypothetical protein